MDFQEWFQSLPTFTKYFMIGVLASSASVSLGAINAYYFMLDYDAVFSQFQIWRILTNFIFFGKFNGGFLFKLVMIYFSISKLEKFYSPNNYSEFFYLILINAIACIFFGTIAGTHYLCGTSLTFAMLYIWCKKAPFERVQFLFGFIVTSAYLPWVMMAFSVVTGGSILQDLVGVAAGHTYIFLKDILPNSHGYNILKTPSFFERLVNKAMGPSQRVNNNFGGVAAGAAGQQQQQAAGFRAFGGRGVHLD